MKEIDTYNEIILRETVKNLERNFFDVYIIDNKTAVIEKLKSIITKNDIIGYGGSRTLEEIDFFQYFNKINYPNLIDTKDPTLKPEERLELRRRACLSDFFLCSANAISQTGELVLIDKWGNRNAALTFGPKNRIVIAGINKITSNLQTAIERAKNKASVLNNIRFNTFNPCVSVGKCCNCDKEERLCSIMTIISKCQPVKSIKIFLVKEELGF